MKGRVKVISIVVVIMLAISMSMNIVNALNQNAEPGSAEDPIVSKSYVDAAISKLSTEIKSLREQVDALKAQNAKLQQDLMAVSSGAAGAGTGSSGNVADKPASLGTGVIKVAVVNLRSKPTTNSTILGKILLNDTVTLVSKTGNWYQVTTKKGTNGYIREDLLNVKK
ncbi:MAG: SH3 domain-containing protein [Clostridiaceae bacterium]|nr:SH3 domain-containing protein [Clostridiaceae bacterium]